MSSSFRSYSSLVLCLVLLLSFASMDACHGRPLAGFSTPRHQKQQQQRYKLFQVTNLQVQKDDGGGKEVVSSSSSVEGKEQRKWTNFKVLGGDDLLVNMKEYSSSSSSSTTTWRVPKSKRSEKHPGFNLDYSPPKTHPPSHN